MGTVLSITPMCRKKEVILMFTGLDNAGKTTALYQLKLGEKIVTIPTMGFNVESLEYHDVTINAWDVGLRSGTRALRRHYYDNLNLHIILFMIDSSDKDRICEAKEDLDDILGEEILEKCIVAIACNKQDEPNAMTVEEISEKIGLGDLKSKRKAPCEIFGTSAIDGKGLNDVSDWIIQLLTNKTKEGTVGEKESFLTRQIHNIKELFLKF